MPLFPGNRSVAPKSQIPKFEFMAGEMKLQLFATFNAVLNCWGMIGWWTTSIIPKKFKTAPKVPSSNLGFWALGATDLFPGKNLAIKKSPSLAPLGVKCVGHCRVPVHCAWVLILAKCREDIALRVKQVPLKPEA